MEDRGTQGMTQRLRHGLNYAMTRSLRPPMIHDGVPGTRDSLGLGKQMIAMAGLVVGFFGFFTVQSGLADDRIVAQPHRMVVSTQIDSTLEEAWRVLVDFASYEQWNNWYRISGTPAEGAFIKAIDRRGNQLDLEITKIRDYTICWTDVTWFTHFGLGGWRCRRLVPNPAGHGITFVNHFEFTGPLRSILELSARQMLLNGMTQENHDLKRYLESRDAKSGSPDGLQ